MFAQQCRGIFRLARAHELCGLIEQRLIGVVAGASGLRLRLDFVTELVVILINQISHQMERRHHGVMREEVEHDQRDHIGQERQQQCLRIGHARIDHQT